MQGNAEGGFVQTCWLKGRGTDQAAENPTRETKCRNPLVYVQPWEEFFVGWCTVCNKWSYRCTICSKGPFGVGQTQAGTWRTSRIVEHRQRHHNQQAWRANNTLQQPDHARDFDPLQFAHNMPVAPGGTEALAAVRDLLKLMYQQNDMPGAAGGAQALGNGETGWQEPNQDEAAHDEEEQAGAEDFAACKIRVMAMMDLIQERKRSRKPWEKIYEDLLKELENFRNRGGSAARAHDTMEPEHVKALGQAHLFGASMVLVQATMWTGRSRQELTASVQGCKRVFKVVQGATVHWRLRCLGPEPVDLDVTKGPDTGSGQRLKLLVGKTADRVAVTTNATSCRLFQVSGKHCADDGVLTVDVVAERTEADPDGSEQLAQLRL